MAATACFARKVALWFEREGLDQVADPVRLRQMKMAIALAASRWNEFAPWPDAASRMRAWLDEVERRALVRKAKSRAEAIKLARSWFEECVDRGSALDAELLEEPVEADPYPPEAVEEQEQPERHEKAATHDPEDLVAVTEPPGGAHGAVEADPDEEERHGEPKRIDEEKK